MLICVHISYQILRVMSNCKIANKKKFLKVVIKINFLKYRKLKSVSVLGKLNTLESFLENQHCKNAFQEVGKFIKVYN